MLAEPGISTTTVAATARHARAALCHCVRRKVLRCCSSSVRSRAAAAFDSVGRSRNGMKRSYPAVDLARRSCMTTGFEPGLLERGPEMESSPRMDAPRLSLTQEPVPDAGSFGVRQAGGVLERAQRIADTLREQAEHENDSALAEAERIRADAERVRVAAEQVAQKLRDDAYRRPSGCSTTPSGPRSSSGPRPRPMPSGSGAKPTPRRIGCSRSRLPRPIDCAASPPRRRSDCGPSRSRRRSGSGRKPRRRPSG